jgi:hypothetical protein
MERDTGSTTIGPKTLYKAVKPMPSVDIGYAQEVNILFIIRNRFS